MDQSLIEELVAAATGETIREVRSRDSTSQTPWKYATTRTRIGSGCVRPAQEDVCHSGMSALL